VLHYAGNQVLRDKQGDTCVTALTLPSPAHGSALIYEEAVSAGEGKGRAAANVVSNEGRVTNGSETVTGTINFEAFGQTAGTTGSSCSPSMYPHQRRVGAGCGAHRRRRFVGAGPWSAQ